jgi:hypothetical protein
MQRAVESNDQSALVLDSAYMACVEAADVAGDIRISHSCP